MGPKFSRFETIDNRPTPDELQAKATEIRESHSRKRSDPETDREKEIKKEISDLAASLRETAANQNPEDFDLISPWYPGYTREDLIALANLLEERTNG